MAASPAFAFNEAITTILGHNHPRRRVTTAATIDEWNLEKSLAFYKDRFADASDFTFSFVGNVDTTTLKPLVEKYLGGLPSINRKETFKDNGGEPPKGVVEKVVHKGVEPKANTVIEFTGASVEDGLRLMTANPAAMTGFTDRGSLAVGGPADFVAVNARGNLLGSVIGGVSA